MGEGGKGDCGKVKERIGILRQYIIQPEKKGKSKYYDGKF